MHEGTPFGRYRLATMLGRGGMGEVWRAFDTAMNRWVALKVLPPSLADDNTYQRRFRREAQVAAGLDEPHIVPIHDFGEIDGRLYVTMRLIEGRTIQELLEGGPLPPHRAVGIAEQIAAALHAAHTVGLVHRDVKPSNILVTPADFAYLIDFGIARASDGTKLTSTGSTIGTVAYMAPERLSTDSSDARADIYALTCVLHECLTGRQPFPGDSVERQITGHLTLPPPRPSMMQPGVPVLMDQVIATGMAKNPEHRYATTGDLAAAARAAIAAPAAAYRPTVAAHWPPPHPAPQQSWPAAPAWQPAAAARPWWRGPAVLVAIALLAAVVIVATTVLLASRNDTMSNASQRVSSPAATDRRITPTNTSAPRTVPPTATSTAVSAPDLQNAKGLDGLLQTIRAKFGDTMGFSLVVYPGHAVYDRPTPTNANAKDSFTYRGDGWEEWGPTMSTSAFDILVDLGQINTNAVAGVLGNAPQHTGAPVGSDSYLIIEGTEGGGLDLIIHSTEPGTGFLRLNPDGSIKQVYPP
ncbi:serine/threonine-protein kinase [Mycolicibacterium neoaurum]|uniref:non-specific serine/threonine protein kinase n=2 Tax=Mycobacteriaceae TaxID=1762 RepID=V5X9D4_MYCNE|nr:serine/threonine protein kinase [Mycolicibacterium neoaurum VKM Ac-1815D]KJQ50595.1 serine/threonine protein kinase [Mycolicibacterium neoaurum]KUM09771.1 serine/threonine protein kinase [Mycolicibacterium neoaurum]